MSQAARVLYSHGGELGAQRGKSGLRHPKRSSQTSEIQGQRRLVWAMRERGGGRTQDERLSTLTPSNEPVQYRSR